MTGVSNFMKKTKAYSDEQLRMLKAIAGATGEETEKIPFAMMDDTPIDPDNFWVKFKFPTAEQKDELQSMMSTEYFERKSIVDNENPMKSVVVERSYRDNHALTFIMKAVEMGLIVEGSFPDVSGNDIVIYEWKRNKDVDNLMWLKERKFEFLVALSRMFFSNVVNDFALEEINEVLDEGEEFAEKSAIKLDEEAL